VKTNIRNMKMKMEFVPATAKRNNYYRSKLVYIITLFVIANLMGNAQSIVLPHKANDKKLVTFQGYHYSDWSPQLAQNLAAMQTNKPYIDGIIFHNGPE